jgi:predicted transcriptional regulator
MAKFEVTQELASTIKAVRVQNNVSAKILADFIGKSQSYISKLEKAEIKTIEERELTAIFQFIYKEIENGQESMNSILNKLYSTIKVQFSDDEIATQMWWNNYDTVSRRIPVPSEMIDDIVGRMEKLNLSSVELCRRINSNEGLSKDIKNIEKYDYNKWYAFIINNRMKFSFIKLNFSQEYIDNVLNKRISSVNYITMLSISFYLFKIEKYGERIEITEEENKELYYSVLNYLSSYRFFSIEERNRLEKLAKTEEEKEKLLSSFDKENQHLVNQVINKYKIFSEVDIQVCNKVFINYLKNLDWDIGFMMMLANIRFAELDDVSFSNKQKMLDEILEVVNKYKNLPDEQRKLNRYDLG